MIEKKPLTLQEFFQALADGKTEFEISDSLFSFDNYKALFYNPNKIAVSAGLILREVTEHNVYLHENPKRQLTPDDVGRVIKMPGKVGILSSYNEISEKFNSNISPWDIYPDGSSTNCHICVTHIRNDNGDWEEIG